MAPAGTIDGPPETASWGWLPNPDTPFVLSVDPGDRVVVDTVSHEGIPEDQGRAPVAFFARHGVDPADVLDDAIAITGSDLHRGIAGQGPHVVTGPRSPDVGRWAGVPAFPAASVPGSWTWPPRAPRSGRSRPPGRHGGNLDVALPGKGTWLHLPVLVPGAGIHAGDPHFSQGNGEVALTAFEAPLRATLSSTVTPAAALAAGEAALFPLGETPEACIPIDLDLDLREAMKACVRNALLLLEIRHGVDRPSARPACSDSDIYLTVGSVTRPTNNGSRSSVVVMAK